MARRCHGVNAHLAFRISHLLNVACATRTSRRGGMVKAFKEFIEWAIRQVQAWRGVPLPRAAFLLIIAAIAANNLFGALFVALLNRFGAGLSVPDISPVIPIAFVLVAFGLLVVHQKYPAGAFADAYPQDKMLIGVVRGHMDERTLHFLRDHDLGAFSFKADLLDPLHRLQEMRGAHSDFINERLQRDWLSMREANNAFLRLMAEHSDMVDTPKMDRLTIFRHDENHDYHSKETAEKVRMLNDAATLIATRFDALDAQARRLIPDVI